MAEISKVGVLGAGTMGNGIAHVFARSGVDVVLCDVEQRFLDRGLETIRKNLDRETAKGKLSAEQAQANEARAHPAVIADRDAGASERVRARYLVAADGGRSAIRQQLGIAMKGRQVFSNSVTIYFRADLAAIIGNRRLSIIYVNNPVLRGFFRLEKTSTSGFLVINTVGDASDPNIANVADGITAKMIRRHPHVFGDVAVADVAGVWANWEALKAQEATGQARTSKLDGIPAHLGALQRGQKMQEKAARVGFDWDNARQVTEKGSGRWSHSARSEVSSRPR